MERVVVVGASAAGLTAAETLRREGFAGQVTLVGDEPHLPYDRPPLSKQILSGAWEPSRIPLRQDTVYTDSGLDVRLGVRATGLDTDARTVSLASGETLPYDGLIIATGVRPRLLPTGHSLAGVHVLRTLDDAVALYDRVANDENAPKAMRDAALVRLVSANFDRMDKQLVIDRLGPLAVPDSAWFGPARRCAPLPARLRRGPARRGWWHRARSSR